MKPLLISSGEPSGVGPDLCLALAEYEFPVVILGDKSVLHQRAIERNQQITLVDYVENTIPQFKKGQLYVYSVPCPQTVKTGVLNIQHGPYVVELLKQAAQLCEQRQFTALVTAPVHKANINAAGIAFTGHTEFFSEYFQAQQVVMMLACEQMKVALVTTHIPLNKVAATISFSLIVNVIKQLHLIAGFSLEPAIKCNAFSGNS